MPYENEYDYLEEDWAVQEHPDAKQKRDRRARELRQEGFLVQTDTETGVHYGLCAEKRKK